jgi:carboxypeptidase Taq
MHAADAYAELLRRARENALLLSCVDLLSWDELTYMPPGGAEHRGQQMALLAGLHHERETEPRFGELLDLLESEQANLDELQAANVRELRRRYQRAVRLPQTLVEELARVVSVAQREWELAKENDDFSRARPWLEKILHLKQAEAQCLAAARPPGEPIYDALLDDYEPGATSRDLQTLFHALHGGLTALLQKIIGSPRWRPTTILRRDYPVERQRVFVESVAAVLGYDFHQGRLDSTAHPFFSAIGPGDCRITTRYRQNQFAEAFFATLHEVGHALYEQGLDPAHYGTPLGESASLAIHESQSRLWEQSVGRGLPFWRHFYPLAQQVFHEALHGVKLAEFHKAVNHVEPSFNRVRADAVTYNLHIFARFEIEQALIAGDLAPAELPAAWNEKHVKYIGVAPPSDAEGCLQDSHWAGGMFGYFPGYTLGNLFAAQLFAAAERELGDQSEAFADGQFSGLLGWLKANVHRHGQRYSARELLLRATGSPPDHRAYLQAVEMRCKDVYGF